MTKPTNSPNHNHKRTERTPKSVETPRSRDAVLSDFARIAGPLRGRNRDRTAKPTPPNADQFKRPRREEET
jgi:hypothetical protein